MAKEAAKKAEAETGSIEGVQKPEPTVTGGSTLKVRLKAGHQDKIQFDPETGITWTRDKVFATPITEFVRTRLGKTLEEVDDAPVKDDGAAEK
jgi:hypothetical protein